jgi:hypothetical protein
MKRKLLLAILCIVIVACVSLLLVVNPGWKAKETLYDSHYVIQEGASV